MMAHPHAGSQGLTPDQQLLEHMARGDALAFHELLRRHGDTAYAVAFAILFDSETAGRTVDAVFNDAWVRASWLAGRCPSVQAWLTGVTRRRALAELARIGPVGSPAA